VGGAREGKVRGQAGVHVQPWWDEPGSLAELTFDLADLKDSFTSRMLPA
jgi:hypothetical protein